LFHLFAKGVASTQKQEITMKLYYSPGACSLAPHIMLNEIGKKFDIEKVDLGAKKTDGGKDFNKINGKGYVPTLELKKDEVLTEVATILQYLADKSKSTKFLPKAGTMARYRAMETLNFVASELHKGLGGLFNKAMPEDGRKIIIERVGKRLDYVDGVLAKNKFLTGKAYGVADAYAFTVMNWGQWVGVDIKQWKNIAKYMETVAKRPAVQAAMKAEGLLG
jgi:glutathione S-transferase